MLLGVLFLCFQFGCNEKSDRLGDSNSLPLVHSVPINHVPRKTEIDPSWNLVIGKRISLRSPLLAVDTSVNDLELIKAGTRSLLFLGSAGTVEGEPFLFANGVSQIHDSSAPTEVSQNPVLLLEDIYRFDSRTDNHLGEYRRFLHSAALIFRNKRVHNVVVVDDDDAPHRVILFRGVKADLAFMICEVFSDTGSALSRIEFTSDLDDVEWVFDSVSTIVVNR